MASHETTHRSHRSRRSEDEREKSRRHRSASPSRHRHRHHHPATHRKKRTRSTAAIVLPLNAAPISSRDFPLLSNLFESYLDVQKNIELHTLSDREAKGRFKSFVSHFNRGELARGWYERVVSAQRDGPSTTVVTTTSREPHTKRVRRSEPRDDSPDSSSDSSDDGDFGPASPLDLQTSQVTRKHGPAPPKMQELSLQRELEAEDKAYQRADSAHARSLDRRAQKEALDELVPRAEPGTRERQLEKKREVNEKMRRFRDPSPGGEVDDSTLLGAGAGGGESFAQKKAALERKKNEREIRREQLLKARIAEREERVQGMREKEEKTMAMLKALAASRFGGPMSGTSE